tara:strand:- start:55 stop:846 length:792 start_codon:yes stop_codon:yes gene_type:complete
MAIKNASDLLVYRKYPSGQKQVTRIKVKTTNPIHTVVSGGNPATLRLNNIKKLDGSVVTSGIPDITTDSGAAVLASIATKLGEGGILYTNGGDVVEGDFTYRDFTNGNAAECPTLELVNSGSTELSAGAVEISVEVEGEDAADKTPIAFSTNASINFNREYRDITNKDSNGYSEQLPGLLSFEMTTDALQDYTSDLDFKDFFDNFADSESVIMRFSEREAGGSDRYYEGTSFVTSLSMDAGVEDNATYSVTFTGTAAVTTGTD